MHSYRSWVDNGNNIMSINPITLINRESTAGSVAYIESCIKQIKALQAVNSTAILFFKTEKDVTWDLDWTGQYAPQQGYGYILYFLITVKSLSGDPILSDVSISRLLFNGVDLVDGQGSTNFWVDRNGGTENTNTFLINMPLDATTPGSLRVQLKYSVMANDDVESKVEFLVLAGGN